MKISKEKLKRFINEEIQNSKILLFEAKIPKATQFLIKKYEQLLPYAQKICDLLPIVCNASIQYFYSGNNRELTYFDAENAQHEMNNEYEDEFLDEITPAIVITLGDSPNIDYEGYIMLTVDLLDEKNLYTDDFIKKQASCTSFGELDPIIRDEVDDIIEYEFEGFELKKDFNVDVNLD